MLTIKEVSLTERATLMDQNYRKSMGIASESVADDAEVVSKDWKAWLKEGTFYVHGGVYTFVRMC